MTSTSLYNKAFALSQAPDQIKQYRLSIACMRSELDFLHIFTNLKSPLRAHHRTLALRACIDTTCIPAALEIIEKNDFESEDEKKELLLRSVKMESPHLVEAFLRYTELSKKTHTKAIWLASGSNALEILNLLLAHRPISEKDRGACMINAAYHGHLKIILALFEGGSISKKDLGAAVNCATSIGHFSIVKTLLAKGEISRSDRETAVQKAVWRGLSSTLKILLESGFISSDARNEAIAIAETKKFRVDAIIKMLEELDTLDRCILRISRKLMMKDIEA